MHPALCHPYSVSFPSDACPSPHGFKRAAELQASCTYSSCDNWGKEGDGGSHKLCLSLCIRKVKISWKPPQQTSTYISWARDAAMVFPHKAINERPSIPGEVPSPVSGHPSRD